MEGLVQCFANYVPLSPINFLERAATVYADRTSMFYRSSSTDLVRFSWRETYERCLKLASALFQLGIARGDIVAALAPNIPELYELHFGVPMAGAVLSALNTKLDEATLVLILEQLEAKFMFVDYQFVDVVLKALDILSPKNVCKPSHLVLIIGEGELATDYTSTMAKIKDKCHGLDYNSLLAVGARADDDFEVIRPDNECNPISVNFTSGSTGNPKGVIYSHRAAYLNSLAQIFRCDMRPMPVFLWTVDMFRCNGWCLAWSLAALGGTSVCVRNVSAEVIFDAISTHKVTHMCGPPSILNIIAEAEPGIKRPICPGNKVNIVVAGRLPSSKVLKEVEVLGFSVTDGYGMTEALGPAIVSPLIPELDSTVTFEGLCSALIEGVDVKDPITMKGVPHDGKTIGEVVFRSNVLMSGYLKNSKATKEAFEGGWYHTGDLGVRHPNGRIQMKDRAVDIIISKGEAISTLEVESVLLSHPQVSEAAVVGKPDADLQEVPCAFVKLKEGAGCCASASASAEEIIRFCGDNLPDHMIPRSVVFGDLPIHFNGKVQKSVLRHKAKCHVDQ